METVLIVIHLMVVVALVAMVLLQRSEGGALGIGGGGGGVMSSRGTANMLTRGTAILAICFFVTSLALSLLARYDERPGSLLEQVPAGSEAQGTEQGGSNGLLDQLQQQSQPTGPQVPPAQ
ncbi:Protein-export membrane protein SecG [Pseudovibrio axinellae]|uniref:Protein-export membrane protein SecG n=1 Tax=Pseudovibrio axinellae TaxID=989403 RepID=A0A166B5J8_9HYPH|nr:preprotein translocase subunit SecG [Pseudovibrio axinellae]KZL21905.1 Protein-export membrane protein SecG [Pseudovibrio axinellae]SEQ83194.1 protein translocase subunit secG [Pseudovibrio axinellae]